MTDKAKVIKYSDDEFVVRMSRENAVRLMYAIGYTNAEHPLLADDGGSVFRQFLDELGLDHTNVVSDPQYKITNGDNEQIRGLRFRKKENAG